MEEKELPIVKPIRSSSGIKQTGIPIVPPIRRKYNVNNINRRFNVGLTGVGESQYDKGIPLALIDNLNAIRAERQPWLHQASNALAGGLASGLLTAGETVAHILDIPSNLATTADYFSKDEDIHTVESSVLATYFKESKETLLNKYLPIYKKDPGKMIDFNDSAFYWESFRSVLDSAVGFGLTGMGAGAAVKAAGTGLRMARLGNYTSMIGKGLNATGKALQSGVTGRLSAAYITNFGEGKIMGLELYEKASQENYKLYLDKYEKDNPGETPSADELQEFEHQSKVNAGKQANIFMMRNKLFIASDYLQLNRMFNATGMGVTNKLIKAPTFKNFAKSQLANGPKEALEEIGQNVIQMEGIHQTRRNLAKKGYVTSDKRMEDMTMMERFSEFAMSEQALLEGAMGFFGGPVQYAITQAPFEKGNNKKKMEHYTSQVQMFAENEKYADETLYKEINKKLAVESAEDQYDIDTSEIANDKVFNMMAIRNFSMGTTKNFREQIEELKNTENITLETVKNIEKQVEKLDKLEKEYIALQKYSTSEQIMALGENKKEFQGLKDLLSKKQQIEQAEILKLVTDYNSVFETDFTYAEYLDNNENLSSHFNEFMNEKDMVQINKSIDKDIKSATKQIIEIDTAIDQFKNSNNQNVIEYIKENVITPSVLTEDKIKMLRLARRQIKGDYVKDFIDTQIATIQVQLDNVIDNEGIEEQGGVDKIVAKAKEANIKSEKPTGADVTVSASDVNADNTGLEHMFGADTESVAADAQGNPITTKDTGPEIGNPSDTQLTPNEINASPEKITQIIDDARMGKLPKSNIEELFDSEVEAKRLEVDQANLMKDKLTSDREQDAIDQGRTPQEFKQGAQVNEAASTNEDISDAQNWNDDSVESMAQKIISKTQTITPNTNTETDVKISFNNEKSPKFMAFLNSNEDKTNISVEYVIDKVLSKSNKIEDVAIKVIINGDSEMFTYLYLPRKGGSGKAYTAEMQLRGEIVEAINNGDRAYGKIKYQYSGVFSSDGTPKNVLEISGFESSKDVKLMYVNKEGHLYDASNKEISTDYNNVITVKKANVAWTGALFTEVKSPNGTKIPMKLNLRKLSENEIGLIIGIYTNMISPAEKGRVNFKDRLMTESPELYDLLPQADKDFLGENVKVSEVLDHLIFNGTKTLANPSTQVYYNKGVLYFGKNSVTLEGLQDLSKLASFQSFLEQFKSRTVSVNKLKDSKYKEFVLNNQIINTDVAIDESGNIFQSDGTNSSDPKQRYKTKAMYVNNYIDNKEAVSTKKSNKNTNVILDKSDIKVKLAEKNSEMKDKIKKASIGNKIETKESDRLRKNMQAKVDKLKKDNC